MDGIVELLIYFCGDFQVVDVQSGLVTGCWGGSAGEAARGTHLAFCLCIAVDIQPGLQVKVLVPYIIVLVPFNMTEGDLSEFLKGGPGLLHQFPSALDSSTIVGSLVGSRTFRTLSLSQKTLYSASCCHA